MKQEIQEQGRGRPGWLSPFAIAAVLALSGCERAPTFSIVGSFFPSWLLCLAAGILVSGLVFALLSRLGRPNLIQWGIVTYPCLAVLSALLFWLTLFAA